MNKIVFLILICIVFLLIRIAKINEIPASLYWDEASIGYNAYSISNNLTDEWGDKLPLHFRAFGEFKLPVYVYSTALVVKLIGFNNDTSVRLPAVLYSLGSIVLLYFLVLKLTKNDTPAIFASLYLAISPWFFLFSRTGYEVTAGVFFFLFSLYLFIKSHENYKLILPAVIFAILSMYSYNSFRFLAPLLIIIESVHLIKVAKLNKINLVISALSIFLILLSLIPIYRLYKYDQGGDRFSVVAADSGKIISNYFSHFSPDFLLKGDKNSRSQIPGMGQIYFIDIPLVLAGMLYLVKNRIKYSLLIFVLFFSSFIPASLTKEAPHALRSLSTVPFLAVFWGLGLYYLYSKSKSLGVLAVTICLVLSLVFFENYLTHFFTNFRSLSSQDWQYGYSDIFLNHKSEFDKYKKIVVSDEYGQPYIFALYYLKYNPDRFLAEVKYNGVENWGFSKVSSFGKFEFRKISKKDLNKDTLVFSDKKLEGEKESEQLSFLDGKTSFYKYEEK